METQEKRGLLIDFVVNYLGNPQYIADAIVDSYLNGDDSPVKKHNK